MLIEAGDCSVLVELDIVLGNVMVVLHSQAVEFVGGGLDGIGLSEGGLESLFEGVPIQSVLRKLVLIKHQIRLVPTEGSPFEPRDSIGNLYYVILEITRTCSEHEFALRNECT
jgi:hypothetical protein